MGSEVMSDNGNTYTLWYTDGVWSARFEPESDADRGHGPDGDERAKRTTCTTSTARPFPQAAYGRHHRGRRDATTCGRKTACWPARDSTPSSEGRAGINIAGIGNPGLSAQDDAGLLAALGIEGREDRRE